MDKIIRDYRKQIDLSVLRFWVGTLSILSILFLSRTLSKEITRVPAFIMAGGIILLTLFWTVEYLILSAARFKKKFTSLPKIEQDKIAEQYEKAKPHNKKWYLEDYLLYFKDWDIMLVKYSDIQKAEFGRHKLRLHLTDNKVCILPTWIDENPAMIVALLRVKNPDLRVIIDGNEVDITKKKGTSK